MEANVPDAVVEAAVSSLVLRFELPSGTVQEQTSPGQEALATSVPRRIRLQDLCYPRDPHPAPPSPAVLATVLGATVKGGSGSVFSGGPTAFSWALVEELAWQRKAWGLGPCAGGAASDAEDRRLQALISDVLEHIGRRTEQSCATASAEELLRRRRADALGTIAAAAEAEERAVALETRVHELEAQLDAETLAVDDLRRRATLPRHAVLLDVLGPLPCAGVAVEESVGSAAVASPSATAVQENTADQSDVVDNMLQCLSTLEHWTSRTAVELDAFRVGILQREQRAAAACVGLAVSASAPAVARQLQRLR